MNTISEDAMRGAAGVTSPELCQKLAAWWGDFAKQHVKTGHERNAFVGACNAAHFGRKVMGEGELG